jgi:hypothetical protein
MTTGFVQVAPDSTGKQLDNDVVTVPAGTIITDGSGNQSTLAAPAYYFRERVVNADPNNPLGVATVTNASGPNPNDFGLSVRMPQGQADLQTIAALLLDIDTNIAAMLGQGPLGNVVTSPLPAMGLPTIGALPPPIVSPTVPRPLTLDKFGRQLMLPHTVRELVTSQAATITANNSTEVTIITAGPSDTFNDVVAIIATNISATASQLDIRDQTGGSIITSLYVPAGDMRGLALGGVLIPQTSPGNNWTAKCGASITSMLVWALYVKNK